MVATLLGRTGWERTIGDDGHKEYTVRFKLMADEYDGPRTVAAASNTVDGHQLPAIGDPWTYGNDLDYSVWNTAYEKLIPVVKTGEKQTVWTAEYKFSSRPHSNRSPQRGNCTGFPSTPLTEPDRIGGTFQSRSVSSSKDYQDNPIKTTSFEPIEVEREKAFPTITVTQTGLNLQLPTLANSINKVNNTTLWGLEARKVLLAQISWEKKWYGACTAYYERTLEFQIHPDTWDRNDIPNWGQKVILGDWNTAQPPEWVVRPGATKENPYSFKKFHDPDGNEIEGYIDPATGLPGAENYLSTVMVYPAVTDNFLSLGIPTVL